MQQEVQGGRQKCPPTPRSLSSIHPMHVACRFAFAWREGGCLDLPANREHNIEHRIDGTMQIRRAQSEYLRFMD